MRTIYLTHISRVSTQDLLSLLEIRNTPVVRNSMLTSHVISPDEHLSWSRSISTQSPTYIMYSDSSLIVGFLSSSENLSTSQSVDWAFYLKPSIRGALPVAIEFYYLNYLFKNPHLHSVNCQVLSHNHTVMSLHRKFGFIETHKTSTYDNQILHHFELQRDVWQTISKSLTSRYSSLLQRYCFLHDIKPD